LQQLDPSIRRIRMTVSYHGAHYSGWQRQYNALTVVQVLEETVKAMIGEEVEIVGSGRTDSGVHALGQVCHMDIRNQKVKAEKFALALNRLLPPDIRILESSETGNTFHARYTAMARMYRYYFKREQDMTAFDQSLVAKVKRFPALELLNGYASCIQGTHDFTTFTASGDVSSSRWRDIYESYWRMETDRWGKQLLTYTICGNAFLYKMVRSLVGSMMDFAEIGMPVQEFSSILASKDRHKVGRTAQACGLYLYKISYDENEYAWFEEKHDE
jgi:tRNA pseudouridine38-40 synthase